jgi:outer membrane receptor protein involved in Fe transport
MHQGRYVQIANGASGQNGLPPYINAADEHFSTVAPGGLITAGPLKGITFEDGGVPRPFRYGVVIGNYMLGGENPNPLTYNIQPDFHRYALLGRLDYEWSPRLKGWAEATLSEVKSETVNARPIDQGNLTIRAENPFIPAPIRSQMAALGLASLTMGRLNIDGGQPTTTNRNVRNRYAAGLQGELGSGWKWDAFAQYGVADTHVVTEGSRNTARWLQSLDAVAGPDGIPVCRNSANGCAPFDIFGPNAASQAARDFVFGTQSSQTRRRQTNLGFNFHGEPVSTWAGPVAVAAGAEYRRETQNTFGDPIAGVQGWDSGNVLPLKGAYRVGEVYAEAAAPLADAAAPVGALALNGAVRVADYSTAGGAVAWKLGGTWRPLPELLIRVTRSRDVRAPNIAELYSAGVNNLQNAVNVRGPNAGLAVIVPLYTSGNPNLKMERANTFTAGATWRPMGGRLQLSADYYSATILNQIGSIGWNAITNRCVQGIRAFCDLIVFDPIGNIVSVNNPTINNNRFVARSIDLEARYSQPLDKLWSPLKGRLEGRAFATRALEFSVDDGTAAGKIDRVGTLTPTLIATTSMPKWTATYFLTYELGGFQTTLQLHYVAAGVMESTSITGTPTERLNNKVSSQTTAFLSTRYNFRIGGRAFQVFGRVNNLFDRGPPFPVYPLSQLGTFYDAAGTTYRFGVRALF